jgi:hypothetical protein
MAAQQRSDARLSKAAKSRKPCPRRSSEFSISSHSAKGPG